MPEERLLQRIRSLAQEPVRRSGNNQRRCIDSVRSHLQRMLNTRQGNVPIAGDYGVPDFLDFLQSYPESVHEVERSIKRAIDKYEPRLTGTTVTFIPDQEETLTLRFQITACLTEERSRKVLFETLVDSTGRIRIP